VQDAGPGTPRMTSWMPWLVGCLLLAALVSAGIIVAAGDDRPGGAVVSATGDRPGAVGVTSTVTAPLPATSTPAPTTTLRTTTTLSPAAVAVLRAIASTTTTTRPPVTTTTTSPPAPTTTAVTPTTLPPTTTTRVPRFTVTLVNDHTHAFDLSINGQVFRLAPNQSRALVELPAVAAGTPDIVKVMAPGDDKCGVQDQGALFPDGSRWRLRIVPGAGTCSGDFAFPRLEISPL
jgi:hypothetical protein